MFLPKATDATHLKAHRTPDSLLKNAAKLPAVCDEQGRPVVLPFTVGQMSDHKGAALMPPALRY